MSEEEIIREIEVEIETEKSENCMFAKWLDIKVLEGLLDLYTKEKEKVDRLQKENESDSKLIANMSERHFEDSKEIDKLQKEVEEKTTILMAGAEKVKALEKELEQEKEKNKELNLENQALYESINCNDDNMLARRYEKLQKEKEGYRELLLNAVEIENKKVNKYWQDKIKDKIKELKQNKDFDEDVYVEEFAVDVLEDLLKEN